MTDLADRPCVPCREGAPRLRGEELRVVLEELGGGWQAVEEHQLEKLYRFANFADALAYVNRVGELAESVDHHPELRLSWGEVRVIVWTHVVDGISETDVVFAARCDRLFQAQKGQA